MPMTRVVCLPKVNLQLRATKDVINRCNWLRNMIEEELHSWTEDSLNMREDLERRLRLVEQREIAQFLELGCACYELWGSFRPPDEMEREMYTQQMMDTWLRNELEMQFRDYLQTTRKVRTFVHWIYEGV
ncbi:hypothetical protein DL89DRAFT_260180 [Linderina pennispora]|uniref:Uncharacterized protein n=1 Tax=Linderina pennispora TaxID=61395 RepID=A0A1Y1VZ76_9FUNG|nr:uncharacterized protein DL89DRAFT_260180 [Linderina pennispora]ORX66542.1 hypothetical protein DL89DRAFT_260180 [Linderina pennispora]